MIVGRIKEYKGKRGLIRRILFPKALVQRFEFSVTATTHNYVDDVNSFIDEYLRPRTLWILDNGVKCKVSYYPIQAPKKPDDFAKNPFSISGSEILNTRLEAVDLVVEFRNKRIPSLYKLRWG